MLNVACVQLQSTDDVQSNLVQISRLVRSAVSKGAELISLPEAAEFMSPEPRDYVEHAVHGDDCAFETISELARELGVWVLVGSLSMRATNAKIANRSVLLDPSGDLAASYDKIHLFDVALPNGQTHHESDIYSRGESAVLANTPWGNVGLTICYDLRFPTLYRRLAQAGAHIIFVPAAFTKFTGNLHWEALLRARAIETGCFIVAPAQCGTHGKDLQSFGHSLIIDPWGRVLADAGENIGVVNAQIDLEMVKAYRDSIPAPMIEMQYGISRYP